jgi:hypothetical protein
VSSRPPNAVLTLSVARRRLDECDPGDMPSMLLAAVCALTETVEELVHAAGPTLPEGSPLRAGLVRLSFDVAPGVCIALDAACQRHKLTREQTLTLALNLLRDTARPSSRPPAYVERASSRPPLIAEEPRIVGQGGRGLASEGMRGEGEGPCQGAPLGRVTLKPSVR